MLGAFSQHLAGRSLRRTASEGWPWSKSLGRLASDCFGTAHAHAPASGRFARTCWGFRIMQAKRQNLFTRDDTIFGVCEAIGEDFHIPANLLRIALAPMLGLYPVATVGGYLAVGCVIALTRWFFPNPRQAKPHIELVAPEQVEAQVPAQVEHEPVPVAA